jgi:SPP1 family predicted phage head-tail adaptor
LCGNSADADARRDGHLMLAPKLRHRIDIEQLTITQDSYGGMIEAWTLFADNVAAEIVPLSGREFVSAQQVQAGVTTRITVRYKAGILENMRVKHGSDVYNIKAKLPDQTLRRHITLMCELGVTDG